MGHGDDMLDIWSDLLEVQSGDWVTSTLDPATWPDWVVSYWEVRGVSLVWAGDCLRCKADPSIFVSLPGGANPVWSPIKPVGDGLATEGEELRQFKFLRTYIAQRYWAGDSLEGFVAALNLSGPPAGLPGWSQAWQQSGLESWSARNSESA